MEIRPKREKQRSEKKIFFNFKNNWNESKSLVLLVVLEKLWEGFRGVNLVRRGVTVTEIDFR